MDNRPSGIPAEDLGDSAVGGLRVSTGSDRQVSRRQDVGETWWRRGERRHVLFEAPLACLGCRPGVVRHQADPPAVESEALQVSRPVDRVLAGFVKLLGVADVVEQRSGDEYVAIAGCLLLCQEQALVTHPCHMERSDRRVRNRCDQGSGSRRLLAVHAESVATRDPWPRANQDWTARPRWSDRDGHTSCIGCRAWRIAHVLCCFRLSGRGLRCCYPSSRRAAFNAQSRSWSGRPW